MQLTLHTDYSLRVLIYLTQKRADLATISEIANFYQISRNHLVKVVHHLAGALTDEHRRASRADAHCLYQSAALNPRPMG